MISWQHVEVMQEHNRDLLREAEKERLIQQMASNEAATVWQKVKGLLSWSKQEAEAAEGQSEVVCATLHQ